MTRFPRHTTHSLRLTIGCLLLFLPLLSAMPAAAADKSSGEARQLFQKAYDQVFGPKGSTLHYKVNIIGLYKTEGTIWLKGKKQKFVDERVDTYNDGTTAYMCFRKKKTVEIHNAASDKKDKYSGKFKFSLDDFDYSTERQADGLLFILKQKRSAKGTIKEVHALVDEKTLAPKKLRIKVAFFWTTVEISRFQAGNISDSLFVFPKEKYKRWKFEDKRSQ